MRRHGKSSDISFLSPTHGIARGTRGAAKKGLVLIRVAEETRTPESEDGNNHVEPVEFVAPGSLQDRSAQDTMKINCLLLVSWTNKEELRHNQLVVPQTESRGSLDCSQPRKFARSSCSEPREIETSSNRHTGDENSRFKYQRHFGRIPVSIAC